MVLILCNILELYPITVVLTHITVLYYITAQYFGATIMMLATSTAVTVVIINVHYRGVFGNDVPIIVRKIVLEWLSRPMCLKGLVDENVSIRKQKQKVCEEFVSCSKVTDSR